MLFRSRGLTGIESSEDHLGPILYAGDSYTDEWVLAFEAIEAHRKVPYSKFAISACPWMLIQSHIPWQGSDPIDCSKLHQAVISQEPMPPRTIFLFGVSPMWANVRPYNSTQGFIGVGSPGWAEVIHAGIDLTLSQLSDRTKVVFIQPHLKFNQETFTACEARNDLAN